jgi:hypothetical protein
VFAPLPFALHATLGCPPHADLALSLAWAFAEIDASAVDAELDRLAADLPPPAGPDPIDQLRVLSPLCADTPAPDPVDTDGLLLHTALGCDAPHPLTVAIVASELGRRRNLAVGIVSNGSDHCLAHLELGAPLLLRADDGEIVEGHGLAPTLTWRCAHETCGLVLDELEDRWLAQGRVDLALEAAELRLHLPFNEPGVRVARRRLSQVRALLN